MAQKGLSESLSMAKLMNPKSNGGYLDFLGRTARVLITECIGRSDPWLREHRNSMQSKTCFVLGNGPSLKSVPTEVLSKYPSFGTNGIFLKHKPTYYVTISQEFYRNHKTRITELDCERKFIGNHLAQHFPNFDGSILTCGWHIYGAEGKPHFPVPLRFSKRADRIVYLGGTVLFVCLQLAHFLGFQRVILLGVDHSFGFDRSEAGYGGKRIEVVGEDKIHFDRNYNPDGHSMHCDMVATERAFSLSRNAFEKDGITIINATENSGLDVVDKVPLQDLI
jgi:hypothetical protein